MNPGTRIQAELTVKSLGRRWWTRVSVGFVHYDKFHWTEREARERHEKQGGQIMCRRGTRWDWPDEETADV